MSAIAQRTKFLSDSVTMSAYSIGAEKSESITWMSESDQRYALLFVIGIRQGDAPKIIQVYIQRNARANRFPHFIGRMTGRALGRIFIDPAAIHKTSLVTATKAGIQ
ncbi:MAG: hypothetical protein WA632_04065 [Gallionella sp.]